MSSEVGPGKKECAPATDALPQPQCQRQLELLCSIIRSLTCLGDKLDDQSVLLQQQTDLLRRIIKERAL